MTGANPSALPTRQQTFESFFLGGFECSTHRLRSGRRLDLLRSTRHDVFAASDYQLLARHGIRAAREGLRWHLIETRPGRFDFSSAEPMLRAARQMGVQIIWDLFHYGWPDDIDIFSADFVERFTNFSRAAAELLSAYVDTPLVCPVNEISFFAWAGGEMGIFNPFARDRGDDLKRQLVRATVNAIAAIREVNPRIRFCQNEPMIHVIVDEARPEDRHAAEAQRLSQFAAWDMLTGRTEPELGGDSSTIDFIGVNYYIHNQWLHPSGPGRVVVPSDPRHRPLRSMLAENHARYGKPIFLAETGIEDDARPAWLRYVCNEIFAAIDAGLPVEGICLYPVLNHPGWDDDRHCYNGLFDYADEEGRREVFQPLADELARQQLIAEGIRSGREKFVDRLSTDTSALDWAAHLMEKRTDEGRSASLDERADDER